VSDFASLLSVNIEDIEAPKPVPVGEYRLRVEAMEEVESSKKGTPGLKFTFLVVAADSSIDKEELGDSVGKKKVNTTFWLTENSRFMLAEFLKNLGITSGNLGQGVLEAPGKEVYASITQKPSDNGRLYNDITSFRAVA
jgi:hypothetical protein